MHIRRASISLIYLFLVMLASPAGAQVLKHEAQLIPSSAPSAATIGHSVAISGDTAVVTMQIPKGFAVAFVFRYSGGSWTEEGILGAPDLSNADLFGFDVAIDGDTAIVTAPSNKKVSFQQGAAFVFERSGGVWMQTAMLEAPKDFGSDTTFGNSVALSGDTAVIGDFSSTDEGRLVVFERSGGVWTPTATITATNPQSASSFGASLAMQGNIIVAGAPTAGTMGSAEVFEYQGGGAWTSRGVLNPAGAMQDDFFGWSVAINGNRILAGSPGKNGGIGAVFVIEGANNDWTNPTWSTLLPKSPVAQQLFGFSVAYDGTWALVGSPADGSSGSVHVFDDLSGTGTGTANVPSNGLGFDLFGDDVALSNGRAVVGAPHRNNNEGAAYAYDVTKDLSLRINWVFTLWPYKYIYTGCPLWVMKNTVKMIVMDRGRLPLRFSIAQAPRNGTLRFTTDTTIAYTPRRGFTGSDAFTIRVTGPDGVTLEKTANVTVIGR